MLDHLTRKRLREKRIHGPRDSTASAMPKVTLRHGSYVDTSKDEIHIYHGIPYARSSTKRFEQPQPLAERNDEFSAKGLASNCPQLPSRFAFLTGNWAHVNGTR